MLKGWSQEAINGLKVWNIKEENRNIERYRRYVRRFVKCFSKEEEEAVSGWIWQRVCRKGYSGVIPIMRCEFCKQLVALFSKENKNQRNESRLGGIEYGSDAARVTAPGHDCLIQFEDDPNSVYSCSGVAHKVHEAKVENFKNGKIRNIIFTCKSERGFAYHCHNNKIKNILKQEKKMSQKSFVKLYTDPDSGDCVIVTNCKLETELNTLAADVIANTQKKKNGKATYDLPVFLKRLEDLACKMRGYKNEVKEQRLLCAGDSWPGEAELAFDTALNESASASGGEEAIFNHQEEEEVQA